MLKLQPRDQKSKNDRVMIISPKKVWIFSRHCFFGLLANFAAISQIWKSRRSVQFFVVAYFGRVFFLWFGMQTEFSPWCNAANIAHFICCLISPSEYFTSWLNYAMESGEARIKETYHYTDTVRKKKQLDWNSYFTTIPATGAGAARWPRGVHLSNKFMFILFHDE